MFSFDPVGSYERETYRAGGSASALLQPLLDNQVTQLYHDLLQIVILTCYDLLVQEIDHCPELMQITTNIK